MIIKSNYHTHTTWCDGKAAPEEFVKAAIECGLTCLGFSAHAMFPFDSDWHMKVSDYRDYFTDLLKLKDAYQDKLQILTGLEADYVPPATSPDYKIYKGLPLDYLIGSVHFISKENGDESSWFAVDGSPDEVAKGTAEVFGGDGKAVAATYLARVRDMALTTDCDIIGHPDLVRVRNETLHFFDETDPWYKRELSATADAIAKSGKVVEINTGGMARTSIKTPYPSPDFLKMLCDRDVPVMINSDAHRPEHLTYAFDDAVRYARDAGCRELWYLTKDGWNKTGI